MVLNSYIDCDDQRFHLMVERGFKSGRLIGVISAINSINQLIIPLEYPY